MRLAASLFALALASTVPAGARHAEPLPELPPLQLDHMFPIVRRQIQQAYARARAQPADPDASGRLAMILDAYQQYAAAAVCYRRAHLLKPSSFPWLYDLGYVEMKQGQFQEASASFRAALELKPDYLPARMNLAESLLAAGDLDKSGQLFRELASEHPEAAQADYGLGRVAAARGDDRAAVKWLEKACELFPRYGAAHYLLAIEWRKLGEPEKAKQHFALYQANVTAVPPVEDPLRAAVEELDQGPLKCVQRGIALEQAGDLDGAIREHEKAIAIDPGNVQAHINLIQLYARTGQYERAEQEYRTAVNLDPNRDDGYYNYGVMMFELGHYGEAEQAFRRALEIDPSYAEAHNNLGAVLERRGRLEEALAEFRKAVAERPDYRLARFHIGRILVNEGQYEAAIQEFQRILTPDDAETPAYVYALGATYARTGDREKALAYLRQARDEARARGQTQLLAGIDRDVKALEQGSNPH
jgi:tetratricopeptide (TPR) repeat protein